MPESFYPSVNSLLNTDSIPESLSFVKDALNNISNALYYKNLQFSDNGAKGYYEMDIIPRNQNDFELDLFDTGLSLIINPDENVINGNTSIHLRLDYAMPILSIINDFSIKNFSSQGQDLLDMFKAAVYIPDNQQLAVAISVFEGEKTFAAISAFIDKVNTFYSLSGANAIPYPVENDYIEMIEELLVSITAAHITDSFGYTITVQDITEDLYLDISQPDFLDNLNVFAYGILQQPLMDYIQELLTLRVDGSVNLALGLAFSRKWLMPIDENGNPLAEPQKSIVSFNAGNLNFSSVNGITFDDDVFGSLNRSQIGNTGLTISFTKAKLDISRTSNIEEANMQGCSDDFIGVFVESAEIGLPPKWFKKVDPNATLGVFGENLLIGTGGISGTFGLRAIVNGKPVDGSIPSNAEMEFKLGGDNGLVIGFNSFDIMLLQGEFVNTNIRGSLQIPGFKNDTGGTAKVGITMSFDKDGNFNITASESAGIPIKIPDVLKFVIKTLSVGRKGDKFYISTSGFIEFLGDGLVGKLFKDPLGIDQLIIWQDGTIELKGLDGTFKLPEPKTLELGPANITVTAMHFGADEREYNNVMRKYWYFGFDGGISINPGGIDARGDGVKVYFTVDNNPDAGRPLHVFFRIQSIAIDLIIPGSASRESAAAIINGYLAMKEPSKDNNDPSTGTEYTGGIGLELSKLRLSASAAMRYNPSVPSYLIDVDLNLPTAIPLGPTGVGIYGFRGLLGQRYVAKREAAGLTSENSWYEYYKAKVAPDYKEGIQVTKMSNQDGFSVGAGVSLATAFDGGRVFSAKAFVMLSLPDVLLIQGQGAILRERIGLDTTNDPPFSAMIAISSEGIASAFGANINIPEDGKHPGGIAKVTGTAEMAFFFNNSGAWYLNIGRNQPEDKRVQARIFTLFNAYFYFMLSKQGIVAGAGAKWDFTKKLGPLRISAFAYLDVSGKVSFKPVQIGGSIGLGAGAAVGVWKIKLGLEIHAFLAAEAPKPFIITGAFSFKLKLPWPIKKLGGPYKLDFTWSFNEERDLSEIPLLDPVNSVKAINRITGESFPVYYNDTINKENIPGNIDMNKYIIPVDSFIDVEFLKGLALKGSTGTKFTASEQGADYYTEFIPPQEAKSQRVMHEFHIEEIEIKYQDGINWSDYNMYEAIRPKPSADNSEIKLPTNTGDLKYGAWQCETPKKYNKLRILAESPLSYITSFTSGETSLPEDFGYRENFLFCEGNKRTKTCVTFPTVGQEYKAGVPKERQRILIRATNNSVVRSLANPFNLQNALAFNGEIELFFDEPKVSVDLKLVSHASEVKIKFFHRVQKEEKGFSNLPLFEYIEITEKVFIPSVSGNFCLIAYKHTDHNNLEVDKVTIEPVNSDFLLSESAGCLLQENTGRLLLEQAAASYETQLFSICTINIIDYNFNDYVKTQDEIDLDNMAMREAFTTVINPIWRPNTVYRIRIKTNDVLSRENKSYQNHYYFYFKTVGPVGHFHKYKVNNAIEYRPDYKALLDKDREDQFRLATLNPYIDYSRSYPNADGRLINAKPLFYADPKLLLFYKQNTVYAMFNNFDTYGSHGEITSELRILIKDPTEPLSSGFDYPISAKFNWRINPEPIMTSEVRMINNLAKDGANCSGYEAMTPLAVVQEIETYSLEPDRLYTAVFNAVYKAPADMKEDITQVHAYVFKTSQYAGFKQQIQSCVLHDENDNEVRKAVFNIEKPIDAAALSKVSALLNGTFDATDPLTSKYANEFDRLTDGILKLEIMPPAITTDFNIIRNSNTGNIVGIIVRNPEPFNDPKIPEEDLKDTIQLSVNNSPGSSYKVIFSPDKTQVFVSNAALNVPAGEIAVFTFRYKQFRIYTVKENGEDISKVGYETLETENVEIKL